MAAMLNPVRGINRLLAETAAGNARSSRRSSGRFPSSARDKADFSIQTGKWLKIRNPVSDISVKVSYVSFRHFLYFD